MKLSKIDRKKGVFPMANRIMLNQTSYHGAGAIEEIANEAKAHAFRKAFVCSDPDLIKFGVTAKVTDILDREGLAYEIYSDIKANPTIENVKNGVAAFKASGADYIIAIGGGSSMDTSKAIGIIIANPEFEDVRSLEGVAPTKKPCVPIIAVPTTAGTAAEVTINYVITDVERKRKFVCVDPHDMPIIAVVDPDMMSSMPKGLTASTGMDALTHAIEGYTTKAAWEMTDMFHLEAIKLISALRMSGEIPKEPDDDRSDQDDTSHLVQVLFRFLPHMDHDGFAGRHPVGGEFHYERNILLVKQEAFEKTGHDNCQQDSGYI